MGGNNSDSGHWEKGPNLTLTMSEDKNTLIASGHWSYKRVIPVIENETDGKSVLNEDFGGVQGTFTLGSLNEKDIIVAQFKNVTNTQLAKIEITLDNGMIVNEALAPGNILTTKYSAKKIAIKIKYETSNKPKSSTEILNVIKEVVRKQVTNENGVLKSTDVMGFTGVRG